MTTSHSPRTAPRYRATNLAVVIDAQGRRRDWLAGQLGVSASLMTLVIQGKRTVSAEHARATAKALDAPLDDLFQPIAS